VAWRLHERILIPSKHKKHGQNGGPVSITSAPAADRRVGVDFRP
jgi:hypothetical protein